MRISLPANLTADTKPPAKTLIKIKLNLRPSCSLPSHPPIWIAGLPDCLGYSQPCPTSACAKSQSAGRTTGIPDATNGDLTAYFASIALNPYCTAIRKPEALTRAGKCAGRLPSLPQASIEWLLCTLWLIHNDIARYVSQGHNLITVKLPPLFPRPGAWLRLDNVKQDGRSCCLTLI